MKVDKMTRLFFVFYNKFGFWTQSKGFLSATPFITFFCIFGLLSDVLWLYWKGRKGLVWFPNFPYRLLHGQKSIVFSTHKLAYDRDKNWLKECRMFAIVIVKRYYNGQSWRSFQLIVNNWKKIRTIRNTIFKWCIVYLLLRIQFEIL